MVKHTIATKALSRFLQLFDGNFPSGAFVHSFGLEPHIVLEAVQSIDELEIYLENFVKYQLSGMEFVFIYKVYKALKKENLNLLIKVDNDFSAMNPYEFAKSSADIGANYLKQLESHANGLTKSYFKAIKEKTSFGNELAILGAYAYELGIEKEFFILLWCKKMLINIATTSLKISRIKPSDIQQMLFRFDVKIEKYLDIDTSKYNSFNPLFEEVIYQHKTLEPKLFTT